MAISSLSATTFPSPTLFCPLSSLSSEPTLLHFSGFSSTVSKLKPLQSSLSSTRVYDAPAILDCSDIIEPPLEILEGSGAATLQGEDFEALRTSALSIGEDVDKLAPKQKIRIKLRSYWVPSLKILASRLWMLQGTLMQSTDTDTRHGYRYDRTRRYAIF